MSKTRAQKKGQLQKLKTKTASGQEHNDDSSEDELQESVEDLSQIKQAKSILKVVCQNSNSDTQMVKFLIGCGADINLQDEHGQTSLLLACIHGHPELAKVLIESSQAGDTPEPIDIDAKDH